MSSEAAITNELRSLREHIAALSACMGARMTQQELADHFGVNRNTITRWERERKGFPRRGVGGKYLRAEVMAFEAGNTEVVRPEGCERTQS
jgi:DNA-binding XRE family transcriptional regulator